MKESWKCNERKVKSESDSMIEKWRHKVPSILENGYLCKILDTYQCKSCCRKE
ncbi:MAG: hypothetical protein ACLRZX_13290 [Coprobacillus cateniformis]